jgi:hypothetical protein
MQETKRGDTIGAIDQTSTRTAQAESIEGAARKTFALAKTIRNIASAIQEGEAKHHRGECKAG